MSTEEIATKGKQESKTQEGTRPGRWYVPDVDILEDDNQLWLWADVPGVSQDQIEVGLAVQPLPRRVLLRAEQLELGLPVAEHVGGNLRDRLDLADPVVELVGDRAHFPQTSGPRR